MTQQIVQISRQIHARIGGLRHMIAAAMGCLGQAFVGARLIVSGLVLVALEANDKLKQFGAMLLFEGADYLTAFAPDQLQAMVYLSLGCVDAASASAAYVSAVCALISDT